MHLWGVSCADWVHQISRLPQAETLGGFDIPGIQNLSSTCPSVPLFDVISIAISGLIGTPLTAELNDILAAQTTEGSPLGLLSIQPPQPPRWDYLPIRFGGCGSLTCTIGVFRPCRISSGGNIDFLSVPCLCILPYAADRLEGQCISRGCRVTSRREINVAWRRRKTFGLSR